MRKSDAEREARHNARLRCNGNIVKESTCLAPVCDCQFLVVEARLAMLAYATELTSSHADGRVAAVGMLVTGAELDVEDVWMMKAMKKVVLKR